MSSHKNLREQARQCHDDRVSAIVRAHGGRAEAADDREDKAIADREVKKAVSQHDSQLHGGKRTSLRLREGGCAEGEKSGARMDRARGGRSPRGHGSHVNVIVAPGRGEPRPMPVPVPAAGLGGPPPPMPPPGGGGLPVLPGGGGMPPGMVRPPINPAMMGGMRPPMVARGGRIRGGGVSMDVGANSALGRMEKAKMKLPSARLAGD